MHVFMQSKDFAAPGGFFSPSNVFWGVEAFIWKNMAVAFWVVAKSFQKGALPESAEWNMSSGGEQYHSSHSSVIMTSG